MRLSQSTDNHRQTAHSRVRPATLPQVPHGPTPRTRGTDPLAAERRLRSSGGPVDNATYGCACGHVFQAPVSTGVECPKCGTGQAW